MCRCGPSGQCNCVGALTEAEAKLIVQLREQAKATRTKAREALWRYCEKIMDKCKFQVGDVVVAGTDIGTNPIVAGKEYIVDSVGKPGARGAIIQWIDEKGQRRGAYDYRFTLKKPAKPKIKVGSTYLTPTGLKRTVVFDNEHGTLATDEKGVHRWYSPKITGGWIFVPPEEWVNLYRRSDGAVCVFLNSHKSEKDAIDGMTNQKDVKWIRAVRVDAGYESVSNG